MKILFVGTSVPDDYSVLIKDNSLAANKFQRKIINELKINHKCDILSFVAVPLSKENKIKIDSFNKTDEKYFYKEGNVFQSVLKFRNYLKKVINQYEAVFVYNVSYPWLLLPNMMKNKKSVLFLADFSDVNSFKNLFLKLYAFLCRKDIRRYGYVVGLSNTTKSILKSNQIFISFPGGIDSKDFSFATPTIKKDVIRVMYSGFLGNVTGVDLLIDMMQKIKRKDFELIITGRGDFEEKLKSIEDSRIKYLGTVSADKYLLLLNDANILINPRNMNLPENQNNFPSKVLDYLAVGKVVVSTKFIGNEDFVENFIFADSTVDDLAEKLEYAIEQYDMIYKDIFNKNRKKAENYIWEKQIAKIMKMF